jgi:hypothetical protein
MSAFHKIGCNIKTKPDSYHKNKELRRKLRGVCCLNLEDIRRAKL